jgi:adenosylhomocysteine nucleosidase
MLVCCLVLALPAPARAQDAPDRKPRIAVITAFEPELKRTLAQAAIEASHTVNGVAFSTGTLGGRDVVIFMSGVSMVNPVRTISTHLPRPRSRPRSG